MTRLYLIVFLFFVSAISRAEESYLGIYLQGTKIGYAFTNTSDDVIAGKPLQKVTGRTYMDMGLLGQPLKVVVDQVSWSGKDGKPTLMKFEMSSAGRVQRVEANYAGGQVHLAINNTGNHSKKTLAIPKDAPIVEDAITALMEGNAAVGATKSFYVLDPTTLSFVKNKVTLVGPAKVTINGSEVSATQVDVAEPRMTMNVYLSSKGDLLKIIAMAGLEMIPLSKEEALAESKGTAMVDLAEATRITVTPPLENESSRYKQITYRFSGVDLSRMAQESTQSVLKSGKDWIVTVKPVVPNAATAKPLQSLSMRHPRWVKPGLNIPAADPSMISLAKKLVGAESNGVRAALKIGGYVHAQMKPNAGIGVLRDAREVLKTKEGVCRDYAILTATLLRAGKIPAKLASGLVYADGAFYYHAWVECWDGARWIGVDSTRSDLKVTAGHVKLAGGSVEDAFMFTFLDRAKVTVLQKS